LKVPTRAGVPERLKEDARMTTAPHESPFPPPLSGSEAGKVLLVVDPSADTQHQIEQAVAKRSWKVLTARDGVEALDVLQRCPVQVVLTATLLPRMDGLQLVQALHDQFPLTPVILLTDKGAEDLALRALQEGAASYIPRKFLHVYLPGTVDQVHAAVRPVQHQRLFECLTQRESAFALENDPVLIPLLIAHFQEQLAPLQLCDTNAQIRVGIALEEALLNGLYHGNLQINSALREEGGQAYYQLAQERRQQPPFCDRRLYVRAELSRTEAAYVVRDEGPGFNPNALPDPRDPANLEKASGRGLFLIRTFMDEVHYNDSGNQITLVKRRRAPATAPALFLQP
jgi:CheY-like chemotaxis protein/anti-sigma regulatory factor (Ser/Thr protein kinase)